MVIWVNRIDFSVDFVEFVSILVDEMIRESRAVSLRKLQVDSTINNEDKTNWNVEFVQANSWRSCRQHVEKTHVRFITFGHCLSLINIRYYLHELILIHLMNHINYITLI